MAWQLTTPVVVGDLDPNGPYTQVKILYQVHDGRRNQIRVDFEYGNTVEDSWVAGITPSGKEGSCTIEGEDYLTLVSTHSPNEGELTYDAVKRGLYEYLVQKGIISSGTVI